MCIRDSMVNILEEARGLSNEAFETMRDQIKESNDALVFELQRLIEALTNFYGVPEGIVSPAVDVSGEFDIRVHAGDGFWTEVDARIQRRMTERDYHGPN